MAVDVLFKVGHAAGADLHCVAVKGLVQHVALWELFVEDLYESPSDVGGNIFAVRGIIPKYIPVTIISGGVWWLRCVWW